MRADILIECINVLNNVDIDNPADQKAISVCENYIMHSYDLYLENCVEMGYPALSQQDYMLEILSLDEGFFKKLVKGAAITAAAGAAAYGGAKVMRANQGFRAANGISSGENAGLKDKVKSNLGSMRQMFKQSAGSGNSIADKAKGIGANVFKGTKVFGKDAKAINTQAFANGNVTRTVGPGQQQQTATFRKDTTGQTSGPSMTTQRVNQDGEVTSTKTSQVNNASTAMQAAQNKVEEKKKEVEKKKKELQDAEADVTAKQTNQQPTNESYSPFIASELKQPLTPAIKIHKNII